MSGEKYIGLDVHQATICVAVMDPMGKVIIESILETKAATILEFFAGLRGTLSVTFEEGVRWVFLIERNIDPCNWIDVAEPRMWPIRRSVHSQSLGSGANWRKISVTANFMHRFYRVLMPSVKSLLTDNVRFALS